MKKCLKTIIPVFALAFILLMPGIQAKAGTITSVSATAGTNQFTVNGVAGDDVLSVAILVYDSTGTTLLQMESVAVDSNHAYTDTFTVAEGTYLVKVADYEGGTFSQTSVTVTPAAPTKYSVITTSGGNGSASASVAEAEAGTTVTLTATPDQGYKFKCWTVESGGVTLADRASATTTFTMPEMNVSVKATFEEIVSSGEPDTSGEPGTPSKPDTPSQPNTVIKPVKTPETGDAGDLSLWLPVTMVALAALAGMVIVKVKRKDR